MCRAAPPTDDVVSRYQFSLSLSSSTAFLSTFANQQYVSYKILHRVRWPFFRHRSNPEHTVYPSGTDGPLPQNVCHPMWATILRNNNSEKGLRFGTSHSAAWCPLTRQKLPTLGRLQRTASSALIYVTGMTPAHRTDCSARIWDTQHFRWSKERTTDSRYSP